MVILGQLETVFFMSSYFVINILLFSVIDHFAMHECIPYRMHVCMHTFAVSAFIRKLNFQHKNCIQVPVSQKVSIKPLRDPIAHRATPADCRLPKKVSFYGTGLQARSGAVRGRGFPGFGSSGQIRPLKKIMAHVPDTSMESTLWVLYKKKIIFRINGGSFQNF